MTRAKSIFRDRGTQKSKRSTQHRMRIETGQLRVAKEKQDCSGRTRRCKFLSHYDLSYEREVSLTFSLSRSRVRFDCVRIADLFDGRARSMRYVSQVTMLGHGRSGSKRKKRNPLFIIRKKKRKGKKFQLPFLEYVIKYLFIYPIYS